MKCRYIYTEYSLIHVHTTLYDTVACLSTEPTNKLHTSVNLYSVVIFSVYLQCFFTYVVCLLGTTELLRLLRSAGQKSLASNIGIVQNICSTNSVGGWGELKNKTASAPNVNICTVVYYLLLSMLKKKRWGYTPLLPLEFQCLSKQVI